MQHFDGEIEKLVRGGIVDFEVGLSFSTNAGNLRLELADHAETQRGRKNEPASNSSLEVEIER
jgi:hypothetical protein